MRVDEEMMIVCFNINIEIQFGFSDWDCKLTGIGTRTTSDGKVGILNMTYRL